MNTQAHLDEATEVLLTGLRRFIDIPEERETIIRNIIAISLVNYSAERADMISEMVERRINS